MKFMCNGCGKLINGEPDYEDNDVMLCRSCNRKGDGPMKLIIATFEVRDDEAEKLRTFLKFIAGESSAVSIKGEGPDFDGQTETEIYVYPREVS